MNLLLLAQDFIASIKPDTSAWPSGDIYVSIAKVPRNLGGIKTKTFDAVDLYPLVFNHTLETTALLACKTAVVPHASLIKIEDSVQRPVLSEWLDNSG